MNLMSFNHLQFLTTLLSAILCPLSCIFFTSDLKTAPSKTYVISILNYIPTVIMLGPTSWAQSFPAQNREEHHEDPL